MKKVDDKEDLFGGGWNYRVVAEREKNSEDYFYSIRDVYYDKEGKPHSWGAEPQYAVGDDGNSLWNDLHHMTLAYQRPLLIVNDDGETLTEHKNKSPISARPSAKRSH